MMGKKIVNTQMGIKQTAKSSAVPKTSDIKTSATAKPDFAFGKINYYIMFAGLLFIVVGFILMIGGGSNDPNVFNENEIFSFRRITLAPILVLTGYVIEIVAILYKSKD